MSDLMTVSKTALERFRVVSAILGRRLAGVSLSAAIAVTLEACRVTGQPPRIPSERTCYRWLRAYESNGLAGLEPRARPKATVSAALSEEVERFLEDQKRLDFLISIPEVIRLARQKEVIKPGANVSRTTMWRAARRKGLPCRRLHRTDDVRRWAYENRMLMALCDGKHFRAGGKRRKRLAYVFLDDATRFGLGVRVTTSENTVDFLLLLHDVIRHHGRFRTCFLDRGPGFKSDDTATVLARLGSGLILGSAGYPEGHGKIERFNRTMKAQVLRGLAGNPTVDDDPRALTLRLAHWLVEIYNHSPHEGLDGETPFARWHRDEHPLDFPDDDWRRHFLLTRRRRVSLDNVASVSGVDYEIPTGHAGELIEISENLLGGGKLNFVHDGASVRLSPVDLGSNARDRRGKRSVDGDDEPADVCTAAATAWNKDYAPLTDEDGGYCADSTDINEETEEGEPDEPTND